MYCGHDNCYRLLDVDPGADVAVIKKAYRRLSLKWHPDKNPDKKDEATEMFQKIATAYEVLSSADMREAYDYALRHPEQQVYNKYRYYKTKVEEQIPLHYVMIGALLFLSLLQYVNNTTLVASHRECIQKSACFKKELQLATDRKLAELGRKADSKLTPSEEDQLVNNLLLNVQVDGMKLVPIRFRDLLAVKVFALPITMPLYIFRYVGSIPERRALQRELQEEVKRKELEEKEELLRMQQRDEEQLRKRQAAKNRKQQDTAEVNAARARHSEERRREQEEQKQEAERRWTEGRNARERLQQLGKTLDIPALDLQCVISLSSEAVVALVQDLASLGDATLQRQRIAATVAESRASIEQSKKDSRPPWRAEELAALAKGMQRFPGGIPNRWGKICNFVHQSGFPQRSEGDVTEKAKSLNNTHGLAAKQDSVEDQHRETKPAATVAPAATAAAATTAAATPAAAPAAAAAAAPTPTAAASRTQTRCGKDESQLQIPEEAPWTASQQAALESALAKYPQSLGLNANERWDKIAACVEGKSRKQCVARFKTLRDQLSAS